MPKYSRTFLSVARCRGSYSGALAADTPADKAIYDRIESLAGDWSGHMEDPLSGPPVSLRYEGRERRQGGDRVPGSGTEACRPVTVYFLASGKLRATQYSPAGNQPAY